VSRIVYREAPSKFFVLRGVDHTGSAYAGLNAEYEAWQAQYLADYKQGARVRVAKSGSGDKAVSPAERDLIRRKEFYR
jgi:hypothetical protein